jgi:hypothetical protein
MSDNRRARQARLLAAVEGALSPFSVVPSNSEKARERGYNIDTIEENAGTFGPSRTRDSSNENKAVPVVPAISSKGVVAEEKAASETGIGGRYARSFATLQERCPDHIEVADWQQAVADADPFLAAWGARAELLGWTARDLFGLHRPPARPHPSYSRLSRYDETGLCWLRDGRPVTLLSSTSAVIQNPTGNVTTYRKDRRPALGPVGDSLDDLIA